MLYYVGQGRSPWFPPELSDLINHFELLDTDTIEVVDLLGVSIFGRVVTSPKRGVTIKLYNWIWVEEGYCDLLVESGTQYTSTLDFYIEWKLCKGQTLANENYFLH